MMPSNHKRFIVLEKAFNIVIKWNELGHVWIHNLRLKEILHKLSEDFDKPYIAYCEIGFEMNACLVQKQTYINNKAYLVSGRNLNFLLLFFNSKLFNRIILKSANLTGGKGVDFMSKIHVPYLDNEKQERVEDLLKGNASEEDRDNFIYDLYNLSSNERNFVQSSYPSL